MAVGWQLYKVKQAGKHEETQGEENPKNYSVMHGHTYYVFRRLIALVEIIEISNFFLWSHLIKILCLNVYLRVNTDQSKTGPNLRMLCK